MWLSLWLKIVLNNLSLLTDEENYYVIGGQVNIERQLDYQWFIDSVCCHLENILSFPQPYFCSTMSCGHASFLSKIA